MSKQQSNILLIYTGGTIGMIKDVDTGALKAFDFNKLVSSIPELKLLDCHVETISFENQLTLQRCKLKIGKNGRNYRNKLYKLRWICDTSWFRHDVI